MVRRPAPSNVVERYRVMQRHHIIIAVIAILVAIALAANHYLW